MRARVALILTILGLMVAASAAPAAGAPLGTLDQQQTSSTLGVGYNVGGLLTPAQQFTAGITGQLDHVDLLLWNLNGGPVDDLTVQIWTLTAGIPASPVPGASATVLEADVPSTPTWVQVAISAPSVAGTQYAIVLSAPIIAGPCPCWVWAKIDTDNYAGGEALVTSDGTTWGGGVGDAAFRTYVTAPPPPTPVSSNLPTPVSSNLPNAAVAEPSGTNPATALAFTVLLIWSLGTLAVMSSRRAVSRR